MSGRNLVRYQVWTPRLDGVRLAVAEDLTQAEAIEVCARKAAAARTYAMSDDYVVTMMGEEPAS